MSIQAPENGTDRDQADVCVTVLLRKAERSSRGRLHDYSKEQKVPHCPSPFSNIQQVCEEGAGTILWQTGK